jgi:type IV secretory pathway VirB2 component (pilin)
MKMNSTITKQYVLALCFALFIIAVSNIAEAAPQQDEISAVLCRVIGQLQGGIGRGIATIAIIVLGIGLFLGKLNWPVALATAIGIGVIFGAGTVVNWLSPGAGAACNIS